MSAIIKDTPAVNFAIKEAQNLPGLIKNFETIDPALAQSLETKTLLASKTPYAQLLVSGIALVSAKYAIGLDDTTQQLIAGGVILLANWLIALIMRYVTRQPIAGIVKTPEGTPPAVPTATVSDTKLVSP